MYAGCLMHICRASLHAGSCCCTTAYSWHCACMHACMHAGFHACNQCIILTCPCQAIMYLKLPASLPACIHAAMSFSMYACMHTCMRDMHFRQGSCNCLTTSSAFKSLMIFWHVNELPDDPARICIWRHIDCLLNLQTINERILATRQKVDAEQMLAAPAEFIILSGVQLQSCKLSW